jgi:methyl-accepting chemotaxis protein
MLFSFYRAGTNKNTAPACPSAMRMLASRGESDDHLSHMLPRTESDLELKHLNDGTYYLSRLISYERQVYGRLYLIFHMPGLEDVWQASASVLGILFVMAAGVALILADFMQKAVSGPITRLAAAMHQIAREKDYSMRMRKTAEDEIGLLVEQFNAMLAEVETRDRELLSARIALENVLLDRMQEVKELEEALGNPPADTFVKGSSPLSENAR